MEINSPSTVADPEGDLKFLEDALAIQKQKEDLSSKLGEHIAKVWAKNQGDFKNVRSDMVKYMRRVRREYAPDKLAAIKAFRGAEGYIPALESKARAAESWIKDINRGDIDLPWVIEPTEIADLPDETVAQVQEKTAQEAAVLQQQLLAAGQAVDPVKITELIQEYYEEQLDLAKEELQKEAKTRCDRAGKLIRDQNQEGGWDQAFKDFLYYFTRLPFSVIKGPVLTKKPKQVWKFTPETGAQLVTEDQLVTDVYCVSPFNIYPSKGMKNANDGDILEIHELSLSSLHSLIGVPGYDSDKIRAVLAGVQGGKIKREWFNIEDKTSVKSVTKQTPGGPEGVSSVDGVTSDFILAQEFYGSVSGKLLLDWGVPDELDPERQYQCNCWKIDKHVIKAVINPDPLGRKPYHFSSWAKNPEWIVGEGLVQFGAPIEDAMNACSRALQNNIAIASGPMAEIDRDRVDKATPIYPWRQIDSTSDAMASKGPAVTYYQPQMHANELTQAYAFFGRLLDEMTVPAYAQGASQSGVTAGTATVFTQLLAAASRSIKSTVANVDDDIIKPYIEMCYDYNMKFSKDAAIKGDARVVAKGVSGLQAKEEAAQRKIEFMTAMSNPTYQQILGEKNLGSLIAQVAKSQGIKLPDEARLNGEANLGDVLDQMLQSQAGVDPMQVNGQVAAGGGAPASPQGTNPDGSKAGVVNG